MSLITSLFKVLRGKSEQRVSLDGLLAYCDRHLEAMKHLVLPHELSKPRTPFDAPDVPNQEVSLMSLSLCQRMRVLPQALPLFYNLYKSNAFYKQKETTASRTISAEQLKVLEEKARAAGVKDIRYVKVPEYAIFKNKGAPQPYAIVFTVEMEKEPLATAPSLDCQLEVMRGYKQLARIGNQLAKFLTREGFAAYPGTALGGLTDYPHLAELAGLGAIGYHGLLITPEEGARLRINTVYTNISNLPMENNDEHQWVREFCSKCKKCIRKCPVNAIYEEPRPRGDGGMQCIEHSTCRSYFTRNYGCAICLVSCPFSQAGYDKIKARFKGNPEAPVFELGLVDSHGEQELPLHRV